MSLVQKKSTIRNTHFIIHKTSHFSRPREILTQILQKAVATNTAIEINAALPRLDAASDVLFRARDLDVTIVINTDAHHTRELARMEWGALQATRGFVDPARVANSWPRKKFLDWVEKRRARKS